MSADNSIALPTDSAPPLIPLHPNTTDTDLLSATTPNPNFRTDTTLDPMHLSDYDDDDNHVVIDEGETVSDMEALSISTSRNDRIAALLDEMIVATMAKAK